MLMWLNNIRRARHDLSKGKGLGFLELPVPCLKCRPRHDIILFHLHQFSLTNSFSEDVPSSLSIFVLKIWSIIIFNALFLNALVRSNLENMLYQQSKASVKSRPPGIPPGRKTSGLEHTPPTQAPEQMLGQQPWKTGLVSMDHDTGDLTVLFLIQSNTVVPSYHVLGKGWSWHFPGFLRIKVATEFGKVYFFELVTPEFSS